MVRLFATLPLRIYHMIATRPRVTVGAGGLALVALFDLWFAAVTGRLGG